MTTHWFGLQGLPFEDRTDNKYFHATAERTDVLAMLLAQVESGGGISRIVGGTGVGKTMLLRALLRRLSPADRAVVLTWPASSGRDVVRETCKRFGVGLSASHDRTRTIRRLRKHLERSAGSGHRPILIVDQAENLSGHHWSQFDELAAIVQANPKALRIVICGQPQFATLLSQPECHRLQQLITGERVLSRMTLEETHEYLRFRLQAAGAVDLDLFEPDAVAQIQQVSGGNPRAVDRFAHAAMLAAHRSGERRIRASTVSAGTGIPLTGGNLAIDLHTVGSNIPTTTGCLGASDARLPLVDRRGARSPALAGFGVLGANDPHERNFLRDPGDFGAADEARRAEVSTIDDRAHGMEELVATDAINTAERLETAVARAERLANTLETFMFDQVAATERLAALRERGEQIGAKLNAAVDGAGETVRRVERRYDELAEETEQRIVRLQSQLTRMFDGLAASETLERIRDGCQRASEAESRLNISAERAEKVQDASARLVGNLGDVESARRGLEKVLERAQSAQHEIESSVTSSATSLRARLAEEVETGERARRKSFEQAQAQLHALRVDVSGVTSELERRIDVLRNRSSEAMRQLDQFETRFTDAAVERVQRAIEERSVRLGELIEREQVRADELTQRVIAATGSAGESIDRVRAQADGAAADALQLAQTVHELRRETGEIRAAYDGFLGEATAKLHHTAAEAKRLRDEALDKPLDEYRAALGAERAALEKVHADTMRQVHEVAESLQTEIQEVHAAAAAASKDLRAQAETTVSSTRQSITKSCDETVASLRARLAEELARDERTRVEQLTRHRTTWQSELDRFAADAQRIEAEVAAQRKALTAALETGSAASAALISKTTEEVDRLQHYVTTLDGRYDQLRFKLTALASETQRSTESVEEWETRLLETRAALEALFDRTSFARDELIASTRKSESLLSSTNETCGRVEGLHQSVSASLVELGGALERLKPVHTQVEKIEDMVQELTVRGQENAQNVEKLTELLGMSKQWQDAMRQLSALAEERVKQLDSHNAAATNTNRQLTEATAAAQQLLRQAHDVAREADAAVGTMRTDLRKHTDEARAVSTALDARASQMQTALEATAKVLEQLEAVAHDREALCANLHTGVEHAIEQVRLLDERTVQAGRLAEKLAVVVPAMKAAQETESAIRAALDDAARVHAELVTQTDVRHEHVQELEQLNTTARGLVDTQQQLMRRVEEMVDGLTEQLEDGRGTVEAGERLRREFTSQAEDLRKKFADWQREAAAIEDRVVKATAKPQEIIATAQSQSAQLEKVCVAVRKVFAGLSQSTLEAVEKTKEFRALRESAAQQLTQLSQETQRASSTLHEWVAEAVRVQARLEKTLTDAPAVGATHPGDVLQRMSRTMPIGALPAVTSSGELKTMPSKTVEPATPPPTARPPKPAVRPDQISAMIEEAKQAAALAGV